MNTLSITGVIQRIHSTPYTVRDSRTGTDSPLHSFTLKGVDGWFRLRTQPVPYPVGTEVVVTYIPNGPKGNVVRSVTTPNSASVTPTPAPTNSNPNKEELRREFRRLNEVLNKAKYVSYDAAKAAQDELDAFIAAHPEAL